MTTGAATVHQCGSRRLEVSKIVRLRRKKNPSQGAKSLGEAGEDPTSLIFLDHYLGRFDHGRYLVILLEIQLFGALLRDH